MPRSSTRRPYLIVLVIATITAVAWGALAFGAVYPWAFTPLGVACGAIGLWGLMATRGGRPPIRGLALGFLVIGFGIGLQLLPLPQAILSRVSPGAGPFLSQYEKTYGPLRPAGEDTARPDQAAQQPHPLSIAPGRTLRGLALFGALALFFLGSSRLMSAAGGLTLARPLIGFGIALALVGIGQYTLTLYDMHPLIYGFWKPQFDSRPFGPFVNPNHFAGWMLMVLPVGLALFYQSLEQTLEAMAERTRNRVSVAGLPEFGRTLMFGFSSIVMGLSLLMTRSRSGVAALAVGSLIAAWIMVRRQRSAAARAVAVFSFLALLGGAAAWAGYDTMVDKIQEDHRGGSLGGRISAWQDTLRILHDFPMTGSGFNTYGHAMTVYQSANRTVHFQEAHNDYLQIAAEGGLLVGLPVLVTLGIFVREIRRRFREAPKEGTTYWLRIGAVVGLVSVGVQSLVEFSLQMPGNAALFSVLAAIAVHQSPNLRRRQSDARR